MRFIFYAAKIAVALVVGSLLALLSEVAISAQDPDLIGMWLFDEGKGEVAEDASTNKNDGNITDAKWVDGKFGKTLEFNGKSAYVEVPTITRLDVGESITILAWIMIKCDGINWGRIVDKSPVNRSLTFCKGDGADDRILWRPVTPSGLNSVFTKAPLKRNEWHHLAAVYDGKKAMLYVNGELDDSTAGSGKVNISDLSLVIGGQTGVLEGGGNASWFCGIIDEVALYKRALKDIEIKKSMEGLAAPVSPAGKLTSTWGRIKGG